MKLKKFSYKKVISTNSTALRLIRVGKSSGFVTSEIQSKGRGQRGNKWISKYGNIFISVFFSINQKISIQNITKKNLNIVKKIIRKYVNKKIEIKRPNDILIEKSKVCGILQETLFKDESKYLIIGVVFTLIINALYFVVDFSIFDDLLSYSNLEYGVQRFWYCSDWYLRNRFS